LQEASLKAEAVLPGAMPAIATAMTATTLTLLGVWDYIPHETRPYVLGLTGLAATLPVFFTDIKNPLNVTRQQALGRMSRILGDYGMPALMLNEKIDDNASSLTKLYHEEHIKKTRDKIKNIKVGSPEVKLSNKAQLAGMVLATVLGTSFIAAGENTVERLSEPFRFTAPAIPIPPTHIVAWIEPPAKIAAAKSQSLPPGSIEHFNPTQDGDLPISIPATPIEITNVHQSSILNISVIEGNAEITVNGQILVPKEEIKGEGVNPTTIYSADLNETTIVSFTNGPVWNIAVTPDNEPNITITGVTYTDEGALQLRCIAQDDFGIVKGEIEFQVPGAHPEAQPPSQAQIGNITLTPNDLCREP
jgi:hypothetical protein